MFEDLSRNQMIKSVLKIFIFILHILIFFCPQIGYASDARSFFNSLTEGYNNECFIVLFRFFNLLHWNLRRGNVFD